MPGPPPSHLLASASLEVVGGSAPLLGMAQLFLDGLCPFPRCCPLFFLPFLPSPPRGRAVIHRVAVSVVAGQAALLARRLGLQPSLAPPGSPRSMCSMGLTASFLHSTSPSPRSGCRLEESTLRPWYGQVMWVGADSEGTQLGATDPHSCRRPSSPLRYPKSGPLPVWSQRQVQEPQGLPSSLSFQKDPRGALCSFLPHLARLPPPTPGLDLGCANKSV